MRLSREYTHNQPQHSTPIHFEHVRPLPAKITIMT